MAKKISLITWIILFLYIALGFFTFFSINYFQSARELFESTDFFMQFNLVWFGALIVLYGLYALVQNYRRINRLGLNESLDTQFLIVMSFLFLLMHVTIDFFVYTQTQLTEVEKFPYESTSQVMLYGALVSGLLSIILPKLLAWRNSSRS